jgi:predicted aspartyl protease
MTDPLQTLREGRLAEAQRAFEAQRESARPESLLGLVTLAELRRDRALAERVLPEIGAEDSPELVLAAAHCASTLRIYSAPALALMERACALADRPEFRVDARTICARLAVAARGELLPRCVAGQGKDHQFPLEVWSSQPVVRVRVNGQEPQAFIVDTGASVSVLTRSYAEKIGVKGVSGASYDVDSPAGLLPTELARVDVSLDQLAFRNVDVALIELPLPGIAGILSPQALFAGMPVELDFRSFVMRVGPAARPSGDAAHTELVISDGTPYVLTALEGRPPRYFLLDTGADSTRMTKSYAALAGQHEAGETSQMLTAGNQSARMWSTEGRLSVRTAGVPWTVERPAIVDDPATRVLPLVQAAGTVGADFFLGRKVWLDLAQQQLSVSSVAELTAWPQGAEAVYELDGRDVKAMLVRERVYSRGEDDVVLEVELAQREQAQRFRVRTRDNWANRGAFLLTRPSEEAWLAEGDAFHKVERSAIDERWAEAFYPFRPKNTAPRMAAAQATLDGRTLHCTRKIGRAHV